MPLLGENMATKIARRLRERNFDEDIDKLVDKLTVALEMPLLDILPIASRIYPLTCKKSSWITTIMYIFHPPIILGLKRGT